MALVLKVILSALSRKRTFQEGEEEFGKTHLKRVLSLFDLVMLGIGSTLGLGAYLIAGEQARMSAGPAVVLSFIVAAVASVFAALCYAEFAARVPKAGSSYVYSYVTVGELCAFVVGWDLIMEYSIGAASLASGLSNHIDKLTGHVMSRALSDSLRIGVNGFGDYPDFLASFIIVLGTVLLSWGVKESSLANKVFTFLNLLTILIFLVTGLFYLDFKNWSLDVPKGVEDAGTGGFMPFGVEGMMSAAAKCFYGFVGFDCLATTGEEAKNPKRDIPLAIVLSLLIITLAYVGMSCTVTLVWPYYDLNYYAPVPDILDKLKLPVIKWIVSIGIFFAISTNVIGCLFPLPRILYSMANDRLLFPFLSHIVPYTQTPVAAQVLGGVVAAVMACLFNVHQLTQMMSIGTLVSYTLIAVCVLKIRYEPEPGDTAAEDQRNVVRRVLNLPTFPAPTRASEHIVYWVLVLFVMTATLLCSILTCVREDLVKNSLWVYSAIILSVLLLLATVFIIWRQPKTSPEINFKVPLIPLVPCVSILMNLYLMFQLDIQSWIRLSIWMLLGIIIYVFYSYRNSVVGQRLKLPQQTDTTSSNQLT